MSAKSRFRVGLAVILGSLLGLFGPAAAQNADPDPFPIFAADLIGGLNLSADPRAKVKIAIWPFDLEIPITRDESERLNESLQRALLDATTSEDVEIFSGMGLKSILADLEVFGWSGNLPNPIALFKSGDRINMVVLGTIRLDGDKYQLGYKMQSVSGAVVAQTEPLEVPIREETEVAQPLGDAIQQIAEELASKARNLTGIRKTGIRLEETRQQPPFAINLEEDFLIALEEVLTSNGGAVLTEREIRQVDPDEVLVPGVYVFSGTYWDQGDTVLIRIQLRDESGITWSARRRVISATISSLIRFDGDFGPIARDRLGPIDFDLKSEVGRDRDPHYQIGERMNFHVTTDVDAWLYCFYLQANQDLLKIIPNEFYLEPFIVGGQRHTIPGNFIPFNFDVIEPTGVELIKCFATDRDVTDDLPPSLQAMDFEPLPDEMRFSLHEIFRDIENVALTEASLVITVLP